MWARKKEVISRDEIQFNHYTPTPGGAHPKKLQSLSSHFHLVVIMQNLKLRYGAGNAGTRTTFI